MIPTKRSNIAPSAFQKQQRHTRSQIKVNTKTKDKCIFILLTKYSRFALAIYIVNSGIPLHI